MILFAAGGTGGHLYPALAIAQEIRRRHPDLAIAFAGTPDHLEAEVVPAEGYPFHPIPVLGMPRRPGPGTLRFAVSMARALAAARALLRELRPRAVVGCGAYVSVPALFTARLLGIPTLVAEANACPGLANRLLGRLADRVVVAIPGTEGQFPPGRAVCLGNPIRAAFGQIDRAQARSFLGFPPTDRLLLVTGGSLGAQALNEAVSGLLDAVLARPDWSVFHLAGPKHVADVAARMEAELDPACPDTYRGREGRYLLAGYCLRMPEAITAADLLVSRAGATIVAELTAAARPALLVPLGINPDQAANARFLSEGGAAVTVANDRVTHDVAGALLPLLDDPRRLAAMGEAARTLGRPDAAARTADEVLRLAGIAG